MVIFKEYIVYCDTCLIVKITVNEKESIFPLVSAILKT